MSSTLGGAQSTGHSRGGDRDRALRFAARLHLSVAAPAAEGASIYTLDGNYFETIKLTKATDGIKREIIVNKMPPTGQSGEGVTVRQIKD